MRIIANHQLRHLGKMRVRRNRAVVFVHSVANKRVPRAVNHFLDIFEIAHLATQHSKNRLA